MSRAERAYETKIAGIGAAAAKQRALEIVTWHLRSRFTRICWHLRIRNGFLIVSCEIYRDDSK